MMLDNGLAYKGCGKQGERRTESSADSLTGFNVERNGFKPLEFGACILKYKTLQHFLNHGDYPHQDHECLLCLRLLGWKLLRLNSGLSEVWCADILWYDFLESSQWEKSTVDRC